MEVIAGGCVITVMNRASKLTSRLNGNPIEPFAMSVLEIRERRGTSFPLLQTLEKMLLDIDRS